MLTEAPPYTIPGANPMTPTLRLALFALATSLLTACATVNTAPASPDHPPRWEAWSNDAFDRAGRQDRLVLLHLGAVWCHWCHVMEEKTWRDPAVVALLERSFVTVYADQDSRPDLANRYEDYGWPATIVFDADGHELLKRRGYIPPETMQRLLRDLTHDPSAEPEDARPTPSTAWRLTPEARTAALAHQNQRYDRAQASWGRPQKFMRWDCVDFALRHADDSTETGPAPPALQQATDTLDAQLNLLDPVWGGVYQYSTRSVWTNPHFEKLARTQAANLRTFARAWAQLREPRYRAAGAELVRYLDTFLRDPDTGAFYVSQDADVVPGEHAGAYFALDDAGRRALGVPHVDTHRYARENGWIIEALARWSAATGDVAALEHAVTAASWVLAHRALPGGGFHDEADPTGPYLADTLAMGRATLALYELTADRRWFDASLAAARFIDAHFRRDDVPGLLTAAPPAHLTPATPMPLPHLEENVDAARWLALLAHVSGDAEVRATAWHAMRAVTTPGEAIRRACPAGILLADEEIDRVPVHITIVGPRDDPRARALFTAALAWPDPFRRLEWFDPTGPPLPNPDTSFPPLKEPAAFLCAEGACSSPIRDPAALPAAIARFSRTAGDDATQ